MDQATTWEEFREACSYSRIPAENMVWADREKTIGYQAVGVSPIRPNWSGLVPVPGDGRYEWDGYLPIHALPHVVNPPEGYFGTANNFMVPNGYPHLDALHYTWGDELRAVRLNEVLRSGRRHTIVDMMRLQHDELSVLARNLVPFLEGVSINGDTAREARRRLLECGMRCSIASRLPRRSTWRGNGVSRAMRGISWCRSRSAICSADST